MKRRLLVATNQIDKALDEARALVEEAPYEAEHHVVLADLYAAGKKDSLALVEYRAALAIDSMNIRRSCRWAISMPNARTTVRCWPQPASSSLSDDFPLELKIKRFENFTL